MTGTETPKISLQALRWPLVALFGALLADLAETLVDPVNSGVSEKVYRAPRTRAAWSPLPSACS